MPFTRALIPQRTWNTVPNTVVSTSTVSCVKYRELCPLCLMNWRIERNASLTLVAPETSNADAKSLGNLIPGEGKVCLQLFESD